MRFTGSHGFGSFSTFGEVADYKKGPFGSALKKEIFVPKSINSIKVYEQQNAIEKDWRLERYFITKEYSDKLSGFHVEPGDVIVSCAGTIGEIYELPSDAEHGVINQALMRVRVHCDVDKSWFLYAFSNMISAFSAKYSNGSAIKNIPPFADLKRYQLFLPAIDEQRKVGCFLSLIDKRIDVQNKIIEEKERLIKVLNDRLYEEAPKKRIRFSKMSSSFNGLSGKSSEDFGTGYPFVTYLSILKNRVVPNKGFGYVSIEQNECQNLLKYGDTLLTLSSETPEEVGVASVYLGELTPLYLNSFSLGLRFNDFSFIDPQYAPWLFATSAFRKHIFPFAQGSTRYNLNVSAFMNSEFEIPNLEDQQAFSRLIGTLATEIETNRKVLEEFRRAKKYLLSAMFI